jgi:hypothetical protein
MIAVLGATGRIGGYAAHRDLFLPKTGLARILSRHTTLKD